MLTLDCEIDQHTRNSYDILDYVGDIGGVFDLIITFILFLLSALPFNKGLITNLKQFYNVKTNTHGIFKSKLTDHQDTYNIKFSTLNRFKIFLMSIIIGKWTTASIFEHCGLFSRIRKI